MESWPEPVVPVQSLSQSCAAVIPKRYVKPPERRPSLQPNPQSSRPLNIIPVIDIGGLPDGDPFRRPATVSMVSKACKEWGFFQVVNHGLRPEVMSRIKEAWREFFNLPMQEKLRYSNTPKTYEGYGSRLGVEKGAILDWGDYFFLHLRPLALKDPNKWPKLPGSCKEAIEEYAEEGIRLYKVLMKLLSMGLGLDVDYLEERLGGEEFGLTMRVNYYPRCPQPELTLGFSPHSDPGTITLLLADSHVKGLQVQHADDWINVDPMADAIIVNLADQMQVLSNDTYKSAEHRVVVDSTAERQSVVLFFNPMSDLPIAPAAELVPPGVTPAYEPTTFDEYRMFVRKRGPHGKMHVDSLKKVSVLDM